MNYLHVNADCANGYYEPVVMKVSSKAAMLVGKMGKIVKQHQVLEASLIEELARINNMSTDEVQDVMAFNDFLVDASQYGTNYIADKEISRKEYEKLLRIAVEAGSMEVELHEP